MTSVTEMVQDLQRMVALQRTPHELTLDDYEWFVRVGIKNLFIDTGRATLFTPTMFLYDENHNLMLDWDRKIDEIEYALLLARIYFYQFVQADVNNIVGYTTDAMSVTGADKPYKNIQDTLANLENERRIKYYKMSRYRLNSVL